MQTSPLPVATPTVKRRLLCMVYEAMLVIAVNALAVLLFLLFTSNNKTPVYQHGLRFFQFLVTAAYFIHAWSGSGHTLAMKTWRTKIVKAGFARVPYSAAALRYLLAWGWFLPALFMSWSLKLSHRDTFIAVAAGVVVWSLTAFLDKDRQFLHDKIAGTRLISLPNPPGK